MLAPYPTLEEVPFTDHDIGDSSGASELTVRVYRPIDCPTSAPVLLWLHGGGYIMGSVDMDIGFLQHLAKSVGCVIASVDYRLAPEHPFPAALEDSYAALNWLYQNAQDLNIDPKRIAISGLSGGGGLAAGLTLYARDKGEIPVVFQLLICPMLDDRNITASSHLPLTGLAWDRRSNLNAWGAYLQRDPDGDPTSGQVSEYASAARAKDFSKLPPTYISVGSVDLFADENIDYARSLLLAGVATSLHVYAGGFHAFECIAAGTDLANRSINQIKHALIQAFNK
jgi:acetyl esterase/lipase